MTPDLVEIIFNQFIEIVENLALKKYCVVVNKCDFDFRVRLLPLVQLIDVLAKAPDRCGKCREVFTTIDITAICFENLPTKKWKQYLKKLALELLAQIFAVNNFVIPKEECLRKCRPQPVWCRFPTTCTTVIKQKCNKKEIEPLCEVVFEKCECIPICPRPVCEKKRKIIIQCEDEVVPKCCGDSDDDDISCSKKFVPCNKFITCNKGCKSNSCVSSTCSDSSSSSGSSSRCSK